MAQDDYKQIVIGNLTGSLEQVRGTELEPLISAALEEIKKTDSSEAISRITGELQRQLQGINYLLGDENLLHQAVLKVSHIIDSLALNAENREKLFKMIDGYAEAVETAKELDPNVDIKPLSAVWQAIADLGKEKIEKIANFKKPTLLVVPKNSFSEKIAGMNAHKRYQPNQTDVVVDGVYYTAEDDCYGDEKYLPNTMISIVDGAVRMPQIEHLIWDASWLTRRGLFEITFRQMGLRLINAHEYALLQQLSLRDYQNNGCDESRIVDFCSPSESTKTCLSHQYLHDLHEVANVASAAFYWIKKGVCFEICNDYDRHDDSLRARPAITILEY
jgi:hypothetical protein